MLVTSVLYKEEVLHYQLLQISLKFPPLIGVSCASLGSGEEQGLLSIDSHLSSPLWGDFPLLKECSLPNLKVLFYGACRGRDVPFGYVAILYLSFYICVFDTFSLNKKPSFVVLIGTFFRTG